MKNANNENIILNKKDENEIIVAKIFYMLWIH